MIAQQAFGCTAHTRATLVMFMLRRGPCVGRDHGVEKGSALDVDFAIGLHSTLVGRNTHLTRGIHKKARAGELEEWLYALCWRPNAVLVC